MVGFVLFGEFSGYAGGATGPQVRFEKVQGLDETMGGFVPNEGAFFGLEPLEVSMLAFSGEKALKDEPMGGQATSHEGDYEGRRPRQNLNGNMALNGFLNGEVTGIRDAGHAAIANEGHMPVSLRRLIKEPPHPLMLIVGMKRTERLLDVVVTKQLLTYSGIFTPNHIGFSQKRNSPKRNILQIANGGGDHPKPPHEGRLLFLF